MLRGSTEKECVELLSIWSEAIQKNSVYGFGLSRELLNYAPVYRLRDERFSLPGVFDNNPVLHNQKCLGFDILPVSRLESMKEVKIAVFASDYHSIRRQLEELGLREKENFISADSFWPLWCFYKYNKIVSTNFISVFVTDLCNLRCLHCGGNISRLNNPRGHVPLEELKRDVDILFRFVDFAKSFTLSGGEPLLYQELPALLDHIGRYRDRIDSVVLISNGLLSPDERVMRRLVKYQVKITISDYSGAGIPGYEKRLAGLTDNLRQHDLKPKLDRSDWFDLSLSPQEAEVLFAEGEIALRRHYAQCSTRCAIIENGNYYTCGRQITDARLNGYKTLPTADGDALNLRLLDPFSQSDRLKVLERLLGCCDRPALNVCERCSGYGQYAKKVPRAVQMV